MTAATDSLSRQNFESALLKAVETPPIEGLRLIRVLSNPTCPDRVLRNFARRTHAGATQFFGLLALLATHAPNEAARSLLLQNLLTEEGVLVVPGKGLVACPELRHSAWSARFAKACGVEDPDASLSESVIDPDMLKAASDPDQWLNSIAFFLLGQEGLFAQASAALAAALRKHGFKNQDLIFFDNHAIADEKHGRDALELLLENAQTLEQQHSAIQYAKTGAQRWLENYR